MEFESNESMSNVIKKLREEDIQVNNIIIVKKKTKSQNVVIQASLDAGRWRTKKSIFRIIEEQQGVVTVEEL